MKTLSLGNLSRSKWLCKYTSGLAGDLKEIKLRMRLPHQTDCALLLLVYFAIQGDRRSSIGKIAVAHIRFSPVGTRVKAPHA